MHSQGMSGGGIVTPRTWNAYAKAIGEKDIPTKKNEISHTEHDEPGVFFPLWHVFYTDVLQYYSNTNDYVRSLRLRTVARSHYSITVYWTSALTHTIHGVSVVFYRAAHHTACLENSVHDDLARCAL